MDVIENVFFFQSIYLKLIEINNFSSVVNGEFNGGEGGFSSSLFFTCSTPLTYLWVQFTFNVLKYSSRLLRWSLNPFRLSSWNLPMSLVPFLEISCTFSFYRISILNYIRLVFVRFFQRHGVCSGARAGSRRIN